MRPNFKQGFLVGYFVSGHRLRLPRFLKSRSLPMKSSPKLGAFPVSSGFGMAIQPTTTPPAHPPLLKRIENGQGLGRDLDDIAGKNSVWEIDVDVLGPNLQFVQDK